MNATFPTVALPHLDADGITHPSDDAVANMSCKADTDNINTHTH